MTAISTAAILTIVTCFNLGLFVSLGLYLRQQRQLASSGSGHVLGDMSPKT